MADADFRGQRDQILGLLARAERMAGSAGNEDVQQAFHTAAERLSRGKVTVAAVGEFKRGKSSLLNALIDEHDLFPVEADIRTNLVSTVSYGEQEAVLVHREDEGAGLAVTAIKRSDIPTYVTEQGNPGNRRRARLLTIELPNEKLRRGLSLVDTPGVGGINVEHTAVTYSFMTSADAVLFVLDASRVLSTEELAFLERVAGHTAEVLFVITKRDLNADYATVVENTRAKAAAVLERDPSTVRVVAVSSANKQAYLQTGDEEDLEDSNFPALERELWDLLSRRGGPALALRALDDLVRGLDRLADPLRAELESATKRSAAEQQEIEHRLEQDAERLRRLGDEGATWRRDLAHGLEDIRLEMNDRAAQGFIALRRQRDDYVDDEALLAEPERIVTKLEEDVTLLRARLYNELELLGAQLRANVEESSGLKLSALEIRRDAYSTARPAIEQALEAAKRDGGGFEVARSGLITGSAMGGLAATGLGLVGLAPVGIAIGVIALAKGAQVARKSVKERERHLTRNELGKRLGHYLSEGQQETQADLTRAQKALERAVQAEFVDLIKGESARLNESAAASRRARHQTREETVKRSKQLRRPLAELEKLSAQAQELVTQIVGGPAAEAPATPAAAAPDRGDWAD